MNMNSPSPILERAVAVQLEVHLDEAGLMTLLQSAYRNFILLKVSSLIFRTIFFLIWSKGLLQPSPFWPPFDAIDNTIILDRLNVYYRISKLALSWFKSYLLGRKHSVEVGSTLSLPDALLYGVPQDSVLGPILSISISLYIILISSIIYSHRSVNDHVYANDTQLYITRSPASF